MILPHSSGPDIETRLEDGRHHPRAAEGDQDNEHGGVRPHHDLAPVSDRIGGAYAGEVAVAGKVPWAMLSL